MKIIKTTDGTDPNKQQPFPAPSLKFLQDNTAEIANTLARNIISNNTQVAYSTSNIYILYGCVNSGVNAYVNPGDTYNVSAGAVFVNGEIYQVDAVSGVFTAGQALYSAMVKNNPSPDPVKFKDGSFFSVHDVRKYVITAATSGGVLFSAWISTIPASAWTDATLAANYTNLGSGYANAGYILDGKTGRVSLRGRITYNNGVTDGTNITAFTLPSGFRPPFKQIFLVEYAASTAMSSSPNANGFSFQILPTGEVQLIVWNHLSGSTDFSLDGISFLIN